MTFISDDTKKIIEKVKKLFSLSQSSNEHEAALALSRAYELLEKYNLSKEMIELSEYERQVLNLDRKSTAHRYVIHIIHLLMPIEILELSAKKKVHGILIVGKECNVEIAKFLYTYLTRQYEDLWKKNRKMIQLVQLLNHHERGTKLKKSYFHGLTVTIKERLSKEILGNEKGLISTKKDPKIREFIEKNHDLKTRKQQGDRSINSTAFYMGTTDGNQIVLNKVIKNTKHNHQLQIK